MIVNGHKYNVSRVRLNKQGYDSRGKYYGHVPGYFVYQIEDDATGEQTFVRAYSTFGVQKIIQMTDRSSPFYWQMHFFLKRIGVLKDNPLTMGRTERNVLLGVAALGAVGALVYAATASAASAAPTTSTTVTTT
jgi:hypothetical protein